MKLPIFYTPLMDAPDQSYSPSASKPAKVVASWKRLSLPEPVEIMPVEPVTAEQLMLVHAAGYVEGVLSGREPNGFGECDLATARTLHYTSGSMVSAARYVLNNGGVAASPTSGFHHAGFAHGAGFCTFNALALVAAVFKGIAGRIAIIDCDMHYGDGTDAIIEHLGLDHVDHFTAGALFRNPRDVPAFFSVLAEVCKNANKADLVLYQAGADPHVDDPLGGWLTTEQLRERDEIVFNTVKRPLVWNLAGGYQREKDGSIPKVLQIHDNTMREWALSAQENR